ncbi:MAG: methyltransferase domain-containing protein [Alicyclobacillus sp.]|nr:methyltransferase domain-containing protein [Alicyclobacillus sp.]
MALKKHFIILSSCGWSDMLQRPHHIARQLAGLGHGVSYIEPVGSTATGPDDINPHSLLKVSIDNVRLPYPGVAVYTPVQLYNGRNVHFSQLVSLLSLLMQSSDKEVVFIVYLPRYMRLLNSIHGRYKIVYDCVDDHEDLKYSFWSNASDIDDEISLVTSADIVLTTSVGLYLKKVPHAKSVYLSKNAVTLSDFVASDKFPNELQHIPEPRVCYVGAVFDWFDEQLFYDVVDQNPDVSFVVIGPKKETMLNEPRDNLYYLGVKPHHELVNYLIHMRAGLIPFKYDIDLIIHCDPIKLYEYVAAGLPVLTTPLPETSLPYSFIHSCTNAAEFTSAIAACTCGESALSGAQEFLEQNSWSKRAEQLVRLVDGDVLEHERRDAVLAALQERWADFLREGSSSIIRSMYALALSYTDLNQAVIQARQAYEEKPIDYTRTNYVAILCRRGEYQQALEVLDHSNVLNEMESAEIHLALLESPRYAELLMLLFTRQYSSCRTLISTEGLPRAVYKLVLAHYLYYLGYRLESATLYSELSNEVGSPLLARHLSEILWSRGEYFPSEQLRFLSLAMHDHIRGHDNRLQRWDGIFVEPKSCPVCGHSEVREILTRADGKRIVSCVGCELAFLEKFPTPDSDQRAYLENKGIDGARVLVPELTPERKQLYMEAFDLTADSVLLIDSVDDHGITYQVDSMEGRIDAVIVWFVLEKIVSLVEYVSNMWNLLPPGGKLVIAVPDHAKGLSAGQEWVGYNCRYSTIYYFTIGSLSYLLRKVGFSVISDQALYDESNTPSLEAFILCATKP